jgi:hypothetical protein
LHQIWFDIWTIKEIPEGLLLPRIKAAQWAIGGVLSFALDGIPGEKSIISRPAGNTSHPLFDRTNQYNTFPGDGSTGIIIFDGASTARIVFRGIFCLGVTPASRRMRNSNISPARPTW